MDEQDNGAGPSRREFGSLFFGSAVATGALIGAAEVVGKAHPDQHIFDMIAEMQAWIAKANAPESDEEMTSFCCGKQEDLFDRFLQQSPQTKAGIRASLEYLVEAKEHFSYDTDEIRPLIEGILASPVLAA